MGNCKLTNIINIMKRIIEKIRCIWHIIRDDEYAVYTITIKDGKRVHNKTCCFISDNASKIFLECIRVFTGEKINEIYK